MYDGDAQNYLLEDKLEMKVVRHYLWNHGKYTLESVSIGSVQFRRVNYVRLHRIRTYTVISLYGIRILPYVRI